MLVYAATIFLSAFLLFQIQPMLAKFILPWFGGSAAVWSAALLFFQLFLLTGYFYAHLLVRYLRPKAQIIVHATLLAASLLALPIIPASHWKPAPGSGDGGDPAIQILVLLGATVGLPYTLLSATSPLLQAWYLRTRAGAIPYRLFALSNFGSMLALLSYPVLVEPKLALGPQAKAWSFGYAAFAVICAVAGWKSRKGVDVIHDVAAGSLELDAPIAKPTAGAIALWIGLAACASTLLLAVTSHLTQNVAPIPLLWIAPLSLYLLSFILCFESDRLYSRILFLPLLAASLGLLAYGDYMYENNAELKRFIPALCAALFVCCMVCHGELARRRPHPRYLTLFYLMVSAGGAAGGLFVALAAPRLFTGYWELPVAMTACAGLVTCVLWNAVRNASGRFVARVIMTAATIAFAVYLGHAEWDKDRQFVLSVRNFYGVLRVHDLPAKANFTARRVLIHGTISHGTQLSQAGSDRIPTSYFGAGSGVYRAIRTKGEAGPLRIGVLGLGAGVTATLARAGDTLHYYEINPLVVQIANRDFGFLRGCPASKQIFLGDGRLVLEGLPNEALDVFVIDAFSSDSIPVHLLTREAFAIFERHLKPDGVMVIHITNRFLDLEPVVAQAAAVSGWIGMVVSDDGWEENYYSPSDWVVLSHSATIFKHANFQDGFVDQLRARPNFRPWTDDYSNVIQLLR
jgi:SAM-dependent methyltransferase